MTCQRMGRYPTGTIGLGTVSEYSRSLIPVPPQKRTTFIHPPLKRVARKPYVAALRKRSATSCEWNYTPILVLHVEGPLRSAGQSGRRKHNGSANPIWLCPGAPSPSICKASQAAAERRLHGSLPVVQAQGSSAARSLPSFERLGRRR